MFKAIEFPDEVERLVRFVEETEPSAMIEATLAKLRQGITAKEMLRASALAVNRSTELPASHHGGSVHPISGLHGCFHTAKRLSGELSFLPIVQHAALCNHHVHSPHMGPYIMPELSPIDGTIELAYGRYQDQESSIVHMGTSAPSELPEDPLGLTIEAFLHNVEKQRPVAAEQCYLWLLQNQSPGEVLDLMLPRMIARNHMDDHYFLYPMLTARAIDCIGSEWNRVLMRPVVRYLARNAIDISEGAKFHFDMIDEAIDDARLMEIELRAETGEEESASIGELAGRIGANHKFSANIPLIADALAGGLSLEGAGEALSIGASTLFVCSSYGNPMDSHLHTGVNTRRYLLGLPGVKRRNQLRALLSGITGPECLFSETTIDHVPHVDPEKLAALPARNEDELIEAITECIEDQPQVDFGSKSLDQLRTGPEVREVIALAQQYVDSGFEPMRLFERLGALVSRDDFTELHGVKQHQALVDEFNSTRESFRGVHLVAAAKSAAVVHAGHEQEVYSELVQVLH